MRGSLAWIAAIVVGLVVVVGVVALVGRDDRKGEVVSAAEWVDGVCGAVGVWRGELESVVEDIRTPNASSTAGGEEPQSETPQGRTGFIRKGLERSVQATETMVLGVENAGIPETDQGTQAAEQVSEWAEEALEELEDAQEELDEEADSLEDALEQLVDAVGAIGSTLAGGVATFAEVTRLDPQLAAAFDSSSVCQQLREETS